MIQISRGDDLHVHLRNGDMMKMVVPLIRSGGISRVLVMPNLVPPITTVEMAINYRKELQAIDDKVDYLMTLYLNPSLTPDEIRSAAKNGIVGVKSYPKGVTTNSESGIENYEIYYPIFEVMEQENLILNIHGEMPSDHSKDICIINAEEMFLPELEKIHKNFPKLRIVLEHVTSKAAVEKVKSLGETVGATITVHHLELTIDDVAGKNHHFCKPIAKHPRDRKAIIQAITERNPKFFLGSDSAPHPRHLKECQTACAGVFTSPFILPYLATIFEKLNCLVYLPQFISENGRKFYNLPEKSNKQEDYIWLVRRESSLKIPDEFFYGPLDDPEGSVVPFWAGKELPWHISEIV